MAPTRSVGATPSSARDAIEGLNVSYKKLAALALPPGGAAALASLRKVIRELQGLVEGSKMPVALPWSRPLPEEQEHYEAKCPEGGLLLRSQVCVAAEGNPAEEWVMGVLFVSDRGVLFEGGGGLLPQALNTGLVHWSNITAIEHRGVANGGQSSFSPREMTLTIKDGSIACLQLQLSVTKDCDWIEEAWRACREHGHVRPGNLGDIEVGASFQFHSVADNEGETPRSASSVSGAAPAGRGMTASLTRASDNIPDDGTKGGTMVFEEYWAEVSLQHVRLGLEADDWTMSRMIKEKSNPEKFVSEPPVQSRSTPGLTVRRTRFLLTLPQDVPRAVASLVGSPEKSNVTQVLAYRSSDDELSVVMQAVTHDVPFGEDFRVQEMYKWRSQPEGGVQFQCWSQIVWTRQLPWTHGVLKSFVAKKAAGESKECAAIISKFVQAKDEV